MDRSRLLLCVFLSSMLAAGCGGKGSGIDGDGGTADGAVPDGGDGGTVNPTPYVILTNIDTSDPYYQAVTLLEQHRDAVVIQIDPAQVEGLSDVLRPLAPEYAAVVLKPADLDINFARRFLMMATELDDDPFTDFSYGYITGATAQDAVDFVQGIIQAEQDNIQNDPLTVSGYAASSLNFVYTMPGDYMEFLNVQEYSAIYLETGDPNVMTFLFQNAHYMSDVKLLDIGENGDPHMLWLFEGGNDATPIWDYDPQLVENPPVQRLGLRSTDIATLDLYPAVAFNGACHSGVLRRTLVESDIMATFGDTHGVVRFYEMSTSFSFALSILGTGLTGYFAPIGANNANDKSEEVYAAFLHNEPLGDVHKRAMDGVVMGFLGNRPALRIFNEGQSAYDYETLPSGTYDPQDFGLASSAMLSGKANRIYYGDPLFNPFANHSDPRLTLTTVTLTPIDANSTRLDLVFDKPDVYFPLWDKFHDGGARIYTTVELPQDFGGGVDVAPDNATGTYTRVIYALEHHRSRVILHLEIAVPDPGYGLDAMHFEMQLTASKTS